MKATRKLVPALAMLLVAATVMSSATFAWFTMSREVTATGMNVTVTAPNNLLIKGASDSDYSSIGTDTTAYAAVYPASSIDGETFFAIKENSPVGTDGKLINTEGLKTKVVAVTDKSDDSTAGHFVDFTYTVKAEGDDVKVGVKSFTVTRNDGGTDDGIKAVRAAVLVDSGAGSIAGEGAKNVLFDITNNANVKTTNYFDSGKAISAVDTDETTVTKTAVEFATIQTTAMVDADKVFTVTGGSTKKIVVRVWIEGEDSNCIIDSAADLDFDVEIVFRDITYVAA